MKFTRITDQQATAALWAVLDDDISAVQKEEDMCNERAEIDRLLDEVDRELAAEHRTELARFAVDASDGQWVRRARRRSQRTAVRSLRLVGVNEALKLAGTELDGEAA